MNSKYNILKQKLKEQGLTVKENLAPNKTTVKNNENRVEFLVIHYFGSLGTAEAVSNYFKNSKTESSAHFSIDESSVVYTSVYPKDVAWHCGASKYKHKFARNSNSIGIEVRPYKLNKNTLNSGDKDWYFTEQTLDNLVTLSQAIIDTYNIPLSNVIRHYDVTGKYCPRPMMGDDINQYHKKSGNEVWKEFKGRLREPNVHTVQTTKPTKPTNNVQNVQVTNYETQQFIWNKLLKSLNNPYAVAGLMGNIEAESNFKPNNLQNSYNKKFNLTDEEYTQGIDSGYLNFVDSAGYGLCQWTYKTRKQSLLNFAKQRSKSIGDLEMQVDLLLKELKGYKSVYQNLLSSTSVKEASDLILTGYEKPADQSDKVKEKRASYASKWFNMFNKEPEIKVPFLAKVTTDALNIRKGPSTSTDIVGVIRDKGTYTIVEVSGKWGLLKSYKKNRNGWIHLDYTERRS